MPLNILLIDGHPDGHQEGGRFSSHLLDLYQEALPSDCTVTRVNVRDMTFTPILRRGYLQRTEWEPDITALAEQLDACDHVVFAFPMWWGAEPAELKGLIDRLFLPGFTYQFNEGSAFWHKYMEGRSADVLVTMDTPPFFLRLMYGNAIIHRWKNRCWAFAGSSPCALPLLARSTTAAQKRASKNGRKRSSGWRARLRPRNAKRNRRGWRRF